MVATIVISIISLIISGLSATVSILSFASNKAELIFFNSDLQPGAIINSEIAAIYKDEKGKRGKFLFQMEFFIIYRYLIHRPRILHTFIWNLLQTN